MVLHNRFNSGKKTSNFSQKKGGLYESQNFVQMIQFLENQLDMNLIRQKQKDPKEWALFLKRGQTLNALVKTLQSI